tara:strand:+ start:651 stop:896 length:246 start_codon:yes stop_codon:yes gene_type:complete
MLGNILNRLESKPGKIIVSFILGIGLATLFRTVCNKRDCLIFEAPQVKDITDNIYKHNDKCYKFKETSIDCDSEKKTVHFA